MPDVRTAYLARKLMYWIATITVVLVLAPASGKDCDLGSLRCASVMGNNVEFCHWDRPRLFKQPEIICDECRKAALGDTIGVACNAIALRNWADTDPIWLQAPLFASRDIGLVGQVQYELRRDMFGKVTIVGTMEGADVTFQRLKHRDDPMFRAIEVAACFEATITSMDKDGTPIHYTLTGPSKAVELKEPNLWVGAQGFASLTLRPSKCRLNRGIKETPPPLRPTTAPHMNAARPPPAPHRDPVHDNHDNHAPDLPPNGPDGNANAGPALQHASDSHLPVIEAADDNDDSVELVYPDGHVEVVPEHYVQKHFQMAPQQPPGMPAESGRTVQEHQPLYGQRSVIMNPPFSGNLPPVQYHAVPAGYGTPVIAADGRADPLVALPPGQAGRGHAGAPVSVVPVIYYVTGPNQSRKEAAVSQI